LRQGVGKRWPHGHCYGNPRWCYMLCPMVGNLCGKSSRNHVRDLVLCMKFAKTSRMVAMKYANETVANSAIEAALLSGCGFLGERHTHSDDIQKYVEI